jgi:hypothetical protein
VSLPFLLLTICSLAVFPFFGTMCDVAAQVDVSVSSAVDTSDVEKQAVLDLWIDYLNSQPGSMWSDQDWDDEKNRLWLDFDMTAPFVYQFGTGGISGDYWPTVMAIEKEGALYSIRTLFYADGRESVDDARNPWAIVRVYAQRTNGQWKLRSALGVLTKHWNRPAIGKITFVSPPTHEFDIRQARRAVAFCDSIAGLFPFFDWDPFYFYVTDRREDVDRVIGLEYFSEGFRLARAMRSYDLLITGGGSEWSPSKLAQMVATGPGLAPHAIVRKGFAGWVGGWDGRSYREHMIEIVASNPSTFQDYVDLGADTAVESDKYFPGAVVCDIVFAAAGASGIETLFKAGVGNDDLYRAIRETTGLDRGEFQQAWRRYVLEFSE